MAAIVLISSVGDSQVQVTRKKKQQKTEQTSTPKPKPKPAANRASKPKPALSKEQKAEELFQKGNANYKPGGYSVAMMFYREAADLGHAEAAYTLGLKYEYGSHVKQDNREAIKWYRKAAELGYSAAYDKLEKIPWY